MATRDSIAIRTDAAVDRIEAAARAFAATIGMEYPALPTQGRDKALKHANRLTDLADMVEELFASQGKLAKEGE